MSKHTKEVIQILYDVCKDGRVFSRTNWRGLGVRELTQDLNNDGYPSVRLVVEGKRIRMSVHWLVAMMHLPPKPSNDYQIRHLDGNKMNSHVSNLSWGTAKQNADDRERHGKTSRGKIHSRSILQGLANSKSNFSQNNEDANA